MNFMFNYGAILEKAAEIADLIFINDDISKIYLSKLIENNRPRLRLPCIDYDNDAALGRLLRRVFENLDVKFKKND